MGSLFALLLWHAAAVLALGGGAFLLRAGPAPDGHDTPALRHRRVTAWLALLGLAGGGFLLRLEATRIVGQAPGFADPRWEALLFETRFGLVWCIKQGLLAALLLACLRCPRMRRVRTVEVLPILGAAFLLIGLWSGHGGSTPPVTLNLFLHAMHLLAAAAWLGGLPCWAWLVRDCAEDKAGTQYLARAITRFSAAATGMMGSLVASGALIAWIQLGAWPALFGTPAGTLLLAKLLLLSCALLCALRLRRYYLPRLASPASRAIRRHAQRWLLIEFCLAGMVFGLGLVLARTTPGAHDRIRWLLPFRLAPDAAWAEPAMRWSLLSASLLCVLGILALGARRRAPAVGLVIAGLGIGGWALSVPAFPDTYRQPDVAYTTRSIARGTARYAEHCGSCHGSGARGQWPPSNAAQADTLLAPDLSEHTALHTAGDMFWWLGKGMPSGAMPAFAAVLSETERWDLVNFLRAFADGHRARILDPAVMPRQPWLGAPDFQYALEDGRAGELSDFRNQRPVLLVLAQWPQSLPRLQALAAARGAGQLGELEVLLVVRGGRCNAPALAALALPCVVRGTPDIAVTYRLLARTLGAPGARNQLLPDIGHAEFLIDRFGFLRARLLLTEGSDTARTPAFLARQVRALAREPLIRQSPDAHVH